MKEPFCTSFAKRQQWLPSGVSNYMVFNFKKSYLVNRFVNYNISILIGARNVYWYSHHTLVLHKQESLCAMLFCTMVSLDPLSPIGSMPQGGISVLCLFHTGLWLKYDSVTAKKMQKSPWNVTIFMTLATITRQPNNNWRLSHDNKTERHGNLSRPLVGL